MLKELEEYSASSDSRDMSSSQGEGEEEPFSQSSSKRPATEEKEEKSEKKPRLRRERSESEETMGEESRPSVIASPPQLTRLQMLQEMLKEKEAVDQVQKVEKEVSDLKSDFSQMREEIKSLGATLSGIESTQTHLILLLHQLSNKTM
jgi:hypothetical protein